MKNNARTVRLTEAAHTMTAALSSKFGVSMNAIVELAVLELSKKKELTIPARDPRSSKSNSRKVLKKAVAA